MKYKNETEILEMVEKFENGTISRDAWGHPEHLIVAFHYALMNDFENALDKMRDGIFNLLKSFQIDLSKEMPYHETLTVFWMRTVYDFARTNIGHSFVETIDELIEKFDKDYPLRFYSKELLFSDEARAKFVEADLSEQNEKIGVKIKS
jgi:hypothetical protein